MANSPLGGFADLSPAYRQLAIAQQQNPGGLNALLGNLTGGIQQGVALEQLPQTIQDQQALQQSNVLSRQLANAINLQKLQDLQNPDAALARKLKEDLTLKGLLKPETGVTLAPTGLQGETIGTPGALTPDQNATLSSAISTSPGFVAPTAEAGAPITPIAINGAQTGFNLDPEAAAKAAEQDLNDKIKLANSRAKAAGVSGQFIPDASGNMLFVQKPTVSGGQPQSTQVMGADGLPLKVQPKGSKGLTGNEQNKLIQRASLAGIVYDKTVHGDLTDPQNLSKFNELIDSANKIDGGISDPALKRNALAIQQTFLTKEPIVVAKKNLDVYAPEVDTAIQDIINNPGQPAGADQQIVFDSFIKALTAGKPTNNQYGQIDKYQSSLNYITNFLTRAVTGQRITNEEFNTYSNALQNARQSMLPQYQAAEQHYIGEMIALGINKKAADKFIKSASGSASIEDFNASQGNATPNAPSPVSSQIAAKPGRVVVTAPDGTPGYWDATKPIPQGYKLAQ